MATSSNPLEVAFYNSLPNPASRSAYTRKRNAATKKQLAAHPGQEKEAVEVGWRAAGWLGPYYAEDRAGEGGKGDEQDEEGEEEEGGPAYLVGLNGRQRKAVTFPSDRPLQVLAGPGSGKTSVLTKRVCHMIANQGLDPERIVCVTFTNKAASEMKDRLGKLVGLNVTARLKLGTFHRIALTYLRISSHLINIPNNFTVIDSDDGKKLCSSICGSSRFSHRITEQRNKGMQCDGKSLHDKISTAKSRCIDPETMRRKGEAGGDLPHQEGADVQVDEWMVLIADLYEEYQRQLRKTHSLDFDDLLSECVNLIEAHPRIVQGLQHVFVDEFQDTNTTQYKLMKLMVGPSNSVTIVGDPDQSVYGWRAADIKNLEYMRRDFPDTAQVLLEQSYRSTKMILASSHTLISQDTTREPKGLKSSHPQGHRPCLLEYESPLIEGAAIAEEIKRIKAYSGLGFGDFAILLRYNALSRPLEQALTKERIPSKLIGTVKFFGRAEVKDLMAYLQLVENPYHVPSFERVVNVPNRGFGTRSVETLKTRADSLSISISELANRAVAGDSFDLGTALVASLRDFMGVIEKLKRKAAEGVGAQGVLTALLEMTDYKSFLERHNPDFDTKWQNVQELITFAGEEDASFKASLEAVGEPPRALTPLASFLECLSLATEATAADGSSGAVTIATMHSAKGLEWPVVFLPGLEEGTMPFFLSKTPEEHAEERRLLFVAQTRAQVLLSLSHCTTRFRGGSGRPFTLSSFLTASIEKNKDEFDADPPEFDASSRADIAKVLGREAPSEEGIKSSIEAYEASCLAKPSALGSTSSSLPTTRFPSTPAAGRQGSGTWSGSGSFSASQGSSYISNPISTFKTPSHAGGNRPTSSPAVGMTPEQEKEERLRVAREKKERFLAKRKSEEGLVGAEEEGKGKKGRVD